MKYKDVYRLRKTAGSDSAGAAGIVPDMGLDTAKHRVAAYRARYDIGPGEPRVMHDV